MTFDPVADIAPGVGDPNAKHPPTFGTRKGTEGIIWHTTEYGTRDYSRTTALRVARDQSNGQPGSYNWIIYDGGALLCVPYLEASGGVNPASAAWAPERFPWLKQMLSTKAYADPNAYLLNVAFQGDTTELLAGKMPPNMYETAARLTKWVEEQAWATSNLVFSGHLHWQSNRSDPGQPTIDRILAEYHRLFSAPPTPPPPPDYQALYTEEVKKVNDLLTKLNAERTKVETLNRELKTIKAKVTAARTALA